MSARAEGQERFGPSGNYKHDELVAEADLLISIAALSDLCPICNSSRTKVQPFVWSGSQVGPKDGQAQGGRQVLLLYAAERGGGLDRS